jgi:CheY-like chemotaxis protein
MSEQILIELIRLIPSFLWIVLLAILVGVFYRPIRHELIPRISGFKAFGLEVALLREQLDTAAEQRGINLGVVAREQVLGRAHRAAPMLRGARVLWVDDHPENNTYERQAMLALGAFVDIAKSSTEARSMMSQSRYDLLISDIDRDGVPDEGLRFLSQMHERNSCPRTIFYIGHVEQERCVPAHAFGISDRPDELLHLVIDALERSMA